MKKLTYFFMISLLFALTIFFSLPYKAIRYWPNYFSVYNLKTSYYLTYQLLYDFVFNLTSPAMTNFLMKILFIICNCGIVFFFIQFLRKEGVKFKTMLPFLIILISFPLENFIMHDIRYVLAPFLFILGAFLMNYYKKFKIFGIFLISLPVLLNLNFLPETILFYLFLLWKNKKGLFLFLLISIAVSAVLVLYQKTILTAIDTMLQNILSGSPDSYSTLLNLITSIDGLVFLFLFGLSFYLIYRKKEFNIISAPIISFFLVLIIFTQHGSHISYFYPILIFVLLYIAKNFKKDTPIIIIAIFLLSLKLIGTCGMLKFNEMEYLANEPLYHLPEIDFAISTIDDSALYSLFREKQIILTPKSENSSVIMPDAVWFDYDIILKTIKDKFENNEVDLVIGSERDLSNKVFAKLFSEYNISKFLNNFSKITVPLLRDRCYTCNHESDIYFRDNNQTNDFLNFLLSYFNENSDKLCSKSKMLYYTYYETLSKENLFKDYLKERTKFLECMGKKDIDELYIYSWILYLKNYIACFILAFAIFIVFLIQKNYNKIQFIPLAIFIITLIVLTIDLQDLLLKTDKITFTIDKPPIMQNDILTVSGTLTNPSFFNVYLNEIGLILIFENNQVYVILGQNYYLLAGRQMLYSASSPPGLINAKIVDIKSEVNYTVLFFNKQIVNQEFFYDKIIT